MERSQIRKNIKQNAKRMLKGSMGAAIGIIIIQGIVSMVCAIPLWIYEVTLFQYNGIFTDNMFLYQDFAKFFPSEIILTGALSFLGTYILMFFLAVPLSFGIVKWFYRLSRGEKMQISSIFDYFGSGKLFARSLTATLGYMWRVFLQTLGVYIILGGVIAAVIVISEIVVQPLVLIAAFILLFLAYFGALAIMLYVMYKYVMYAYISVRNPDWGNRKIFPHSVARMKGHKFELFVFELSFLPWMLLGIPTCGLIFFWLEPYMTASFTLFYNYTYGDEGGEPGEINAYADGAQYVIADASEPDTAADTASDAAENTDTDILSEAAAPEPGDAETEGGDSASDEKADS